MLIAFMTLALFLGSTILPNKVVKAAEDEYLVFIALGADSTAEGASWDVQYYGPEHSGNSANVEAVTATVKNGETATVSLTVPTIKYTWFLAPCVVVGDKVLDASSTFDVKVSIDGTDVTDTVNKDAGVPFWNEATGDYTETQCVRIGAGYNEWGDKYMAESPTGFTKIEYTVTLNIVEGTAAASDVVESTSEYDAFIALGADSKAEGASWDVQYYGSDVEGIEATNGKLKNGETTTISLKVPEVNYTWFVAPTINTNGDVFAEGTTFDVKVSLNGTDITDKVDFSAGKAFWNEATGDLTEENCVRIAGGYNEWGDKYMAESPKDFTEITYTITPHILLSTGASEGAEAVAVDLDGTYNAYFGIQTPTYTFRNSYDDATYGLGTDTFNQLTGWVDDVATAMPGTITDTVIEGNGTYKVSLTDFDFSTDFAEAEAFNLIFVSTDMPVNDQIQITDVKLIMDGKTVYTFDNYYQDPEVSNVKMLLVNGYNAELPVFSYAVPKTSIEIEFTVAGFNYDKAVEEVVATEAPTQEPTETPTATPTEAVQETMTDSAESSTNTGLIVGIVIGVVVVAGIVTFAVINNKKKQSK